MMCGGCHDFKIVVVTRLRTNHTRFAPNRGVNRPQPGTTTPEGRRLRAERVHPPPARGPVRRDAGARRAAPEARFGLHSHTVLSCAEPERLN